MKRIYQTLIVCLMIPLGAAAQDKTYSLDDCIRFALENAIEVKNAKVDEKISESVVKETIGIGLPQIDGSVNVTNNPKLPRFYAQYVEGAEGGFFPLQDIPGIQNGDLVALPNFFQQPNSGSAGLTINQLIFNSQYLVGLKASNTYKELSYRATEQTEIQVIENVARAYYVVLVNNERIALFDNNIARVDSLLRSTRAMYENGFAEQIDVDRTQVTLNNLKSERLNFLNLQNLGYVLLKFQMNYPMDQPIAVSGTLADLKVNENLFNEYKDGWDYKNRIEYKMLDTQRRLQELDIKNKLSQSLPSLNGFVNLGYSTMSPTVGGIFKTEANIEKTDMYGPDAWYPYSSIGVTLNLPIFSGLQRSQRLQQSKLELQKIENSFTSLKQAIDLSIQQNTITYQNALETLKSQQENMELADRVARVTKIKFEQGVGSNIEVTDAESSLRTAQVNYYNALADAILSKIDLDKAYGKINPAHYKTTTTPQN
jgi:outer membrane protein TolC